MSLLPANDEEFFIETREASPANLLIKIESFSLLSEYGIETHESREFVAGDYKWRLVIHPDGYESEEEGDYVSVYLSAAGISTLPIDWEINAIFSFFLYNHISDNYLCFRGKGRRFHALNPKWGFAKLISKKSLTDPSNGFLVDDSCVFGAEVFVIKSQRIIESLCLKRVTHPYKREWEISKFSELGLVWDSEEFEAEDLKWKIRLYPNGSVSENGRSASIFLHCIDSKSFAPHEKVKAQICFCIKNKLHDKHHSLNFTNWFAPASGSRGFRNFIPIADMKGYVFDDAFSLEIEISVQAFVRDPPKSKGGLSINARISE
ncbi:hypothetical protein C2S51_013559 [Perilla frutescens var. frutescens]|nr:hypothetical protein C2S51_013559 [Perilla frutescens var. frutescens]